MHNIYLGLSKAEVDMWNNSFNIAIIEWLNQYSQFSLKFNLVIAYIENAYAFKGLAVISMLWYLWLKDSNLLSETKFIVFSAIISCILALIVTSAINYIAPFQPTPMANELIGFQIPSGVDINKSANTGHGWINSFPSHHATMFYALATGIFLASRRFGYFAFIYVTLFIAFPRIYLGYHYPTDIIAGATVGILTVNLVNQFKEVYRKPFMTLMMKYPALSQTALFIVMFEIAVLFGDAINFLRLLVKYLLK
jgi:undecaprenyl-diphosphatase